MTKKKCHNHDTSTPSTDQQTSVETDRHAVNVLSDAEEDKIVMKNMFPVVGIGAAEGGMAAVEAFFTHLPVDAGTGIAFMLVQDISPPSDLNFLSEIVQHFTNMTVTEIIDWMPVAPNHVYIIPPNIVIELFHHHLHIWDELSPYDLPIDAFFCSLAQDMYARAIGIVLSGEGSDGALGISAVKATGGMSMAQLPESAAFASMPLSAIATSLVDYVLKPKEMPGVIIAYVQHFFMHSRQVWKQLTAISDELLQQIFILLHVQTPHDFSGEKNILLRRIRERMAIHRIESLADYMRYLQQSPREVTILSTIIDLTKHLKNNG